MTFGPASVVLCDFCDTAMGVAFYYLEPMYSGYLFMCSNPKCRHKKQPIAEQEAFLLIGPSRGDFECHCVNCDKSKKAEGIRNRDYLEKERNLYDV